MGLVGGCWRYRGVYVAMVEWDGFVMRWRGGRSEVRVKVCRDDGGWGMGEFWVRWRGCQRA